MIGRLGVLIVLGLVAGCAAPQGGSPVAPQPARVAAAAEPVEPAMPISARQPEYPDWADLDEFETEVTVRYAVHEDGSVRPISAIGPAAFRAKALEAVETWRFKPAMRAGRAVTTQRTARFVFRVRA